MKNKTLIILLSTLILFFFINTVTFATNVEDFKNDVNNTTDNIIDSVNNTKENIKDGLKKAEDNVENSMENTRDALTTPTEDTENDNYSASRVSTTTDATTTSTSYITWIIVALAFAVILGLIWYYLAQVNTYNT